MEGFGIFVLNIVTDIIINNKSIGLENFDGKKITIIYL